MLTRMELADSFADMLCETRNIAGKTQREMAKAMGKSIGTIQNWESGISTPDVIDLVFWFHTVGLNPMHYIFRALHPDYPPINNVDGMREKMVKYVAETMTDWAIQLMFFNITASHGSSAIQQQNMLAMNNLTSMESRARVARMVLDNYRMEERLGKLISHDKVTVSPESLKNALNAGIDAVADGKSGYVGITG